ncbi:hypothetical protein [Haloglycomyces albus]|uniref:hypothetical protein n=1 Tax=Haloglycomyces albus TaxID=526067 RepID=UPI00046D9037|nr:hypothetical protein [Haloglycomyces albus]
MYSNLAQDDDDPGFFSGIVVDAWEAICRSFAETALSMLEAFADGFLAMPSIDVSSDGITSVYGLSMGLGIVIVGFLFFLQIGRSVFRSDGRPLGEAFVGLGQTVMAFLLTLTLASTALAASDDLTTWIIDTSFGNTDGLKGRLAVLFELNPGMAATLLLIVGLIGILVTLLLWFELLLRNAALAVLIATSPIAAAGQVGSSTRSWWTTLVGVTIQLIMLKPIIALVFSVGLMLTADESSDISTVLSGLLVLILAALAWPAVARFFTFAQTHVGSSMGMAGFAGAAGGALGTKAGMQAGTAGTTPDRFGDMAAARNAGTIARSQSAASGVGGGAAKGAGLKAAAATPVGAAAIALQGVQKAGNTLVQRTEQMAAHGGMDGANPYALPGGPSRGSAPYPTQARNDLTATGPHPAAPRGDGNDTSQAKESTTPAAPPSSNTPPPPPQEAPRDHQPPRSSPRPDPEKGYY